MFRIIVILIFSLIINGCATLSQTSDEFVAAFKNVNGEGSVASKSSEIIPSSLQLSTNRLKKKLLPCLNGTVTTTHNLIKTSEIEWKPKISINKKHTRLTLQHDYKIGHIAAANKPPKDGIYIAVIDLDYMSKNKTKATYYYATTTKHSVIEPAKRILRGRAGECKFK